MKIGVIMGGISSEREVSLKSGKEVIDNLNKTKYEKIIPIIIDNKDDVIEKVKGVDYVFIALHGQFGEDGTIQGALETLGIKYSGCGVLTSSICMNKGLTKRIIKTVGVNTPNWTIVKDINEIDYNLIEKIGYPVFIKPNNGGSSVATYLVKDEKQVIKAVEEGLKYDNEVMIEKFIKGEEITSFVLDGEVFPTVKISTNNNEFFDYKAKYSCDGAEEVVVDLEKEMQDLVVRYSKEIWKVLSCKGYCRIDMIISDNSLYVLEVNTLPGLTKTSLIPKSAMAKGLTFSSLLDKIIELS